MGKELEVGKELEDLEKVFILNENMEHEDIKSLISRILKFCKIDNNGFVVINKNKLNTIDNIMMTYSHD